MELSSYSPVLVQVILAVAIGAVIILAVYIDVLRQKVMQVGRR